MYMQINYDLSHGAIFDDLEGLLSQGLKTCHYSMLNTSKTIRDENKVMYN